MAAFLNKWFSFTFLILFSGAKMMAADAIDIKPLSHIKVLHPFHVSVVEINHNAADKTLEISCKLFTDDFEGVLAKNYKTKTDLINPPSKAAMDTLVKKYILSHLGIKIDGRQVALSYVGFEQEKESVYCYIEATGVSSVAKVEMYNSLMHDYFDDQINIIHVIAGGNRKSTKLDYPDKQAVIVF